MRNLYGKFRGLFPFMKPTYQVSEAQWIPSVSCSKAHFLYFKKLKGCFQQKVTYLDVFS
jgi:hypothetical protein